MFIDRLSNISGKCGYSRHLRFGIIHLNFNTNRNTAIFNMWLRGKRQCKKKKKRQKKKNTDENTTVRKNKWQIQIKTLRFISILMTSFQLNFQLIHIGIASHQSFVVNAKASDNFLTFYNFWGISHRLKKRLSNFLNGCLAFSKC